MTLQLVAEPPVSLEKTVRALQRLPTNEIEVWEGGEYRRLLLVDDQDAALRVTQLGPDVVQVEIHAHRETADLISREKE